MKNETFEEILGISDLPHDTCQVCHVVMTDDEIARQTIGNPETAICDNCRKLSKEE